MKGLFNELRVPVKLTIKGDNQRSIKLIKNPEFYQRTGYIPLEEHFIHDKVEVGRIEVEWVTTEEQLTNGLIKPLANNKHQEMMKELGIVDILVPGVRFHYPV